MPNNINGTRPNVPSAQDADAASRPASPAAARQAAGSATSSVTGSGTSSPTGAASGERVPSLPPRRNTAMQASLMAALTDLQDGAEASMPTRSAARRPSGGFVRTQQSAPDVLDAPHLPNALNLPGPGSRMQALLLAALEARQEIASGASTCSSGAASASLGSAGSQPPSGTSTPQVIDWRLAAALAEHQRSPDVRSLASSVFGASVAGTPAEMEPGSAHGSLAPLSRQELVVQWNIWASQESSDESRSEAVRRMREWSEESPDVELDLSGLELSSLPENLPTGLRRLDLSGNLFPGFPENLPETLEALDIGWNTPPLEELPERLPARLRALILRENHLTSLPEQLPAGLVNLNVYGNRLTRLPEHLPAGLRILDIRNNPLEDLPEGLPGSLRQLDAAGIGMTSLPESILLLHPDCIVDASDNPLTERVRNRLNELMNARDYQGPYVTFSMPAGAQAMPERPLHEAVAAWPLPSGTDAAQRTERWQAFADEPGAASFSRFLDRLAGTVNAGNEHFRHSVGEWLNHLETSPALRQQTFQVSEGATASCEDRVSLSLNAMRQLRLASDVDNGEYDHRLPALLDLARGVFRLDQLEGIAREKTASLNFVDEIEVYLAYQVKLRETLALPLDTPDMRFFNVSYVTPQDLEQAEARVLAAEQQEFADYLSTRWQPWQSVLQRLEPEGHAQAREALIEAMGDEFSNRLQARLREAGLENDADAQRTVGPQVHAEIAREIMGQLTRDFLTRHGLEDHLPPR